MIPLEKVQLIVKKYETLEKELASGNIDKNDFVTKSKEYSSIGNVINEARSYISFQKEKEELSKIIDEKNGDKAMIELAENELKELFKKNEEQEKILKVFLLPKDEADGKNAILEIRAGTGGLEATLFVADLYKMYEKVCAIKKWSLEIINISKSEAGGFKEVILLIKGTDIYSFLKFESGVHRVQRVPETETQGRVHTSAATVAVLPEAEEVDIKINEKDLRIDVFRSSGPGGQSVNTTDSAVRITHLPTGIVVQCQNQRSQLKNKNIAIKILSSKLYQLKLDEISNEKTKLNDSKVDISWGSQIRSYVFHPYNMIKDHRTKYETSNIQAVMNGDIDGFINAYLLTNLEK